MNDALFSAMFLSFLVLVWLSVLGIFLYINNQAKKFLASVIAEGHRPRYQKSISGKYKSIRFKGPLLKVAVFEDFLIVHTSRISFSQIQSIQHHLFGFEMTISGHSNITLYDKTILQYLPAAEDDNTTSPKIDVIR